MIGTLKTHHLKRYKDIASLLIRHGRADLAQAIQMDENLPQDDSASADVISGDPEQLARDLEKLGPTFIKLGQLLSTRSDLLPQPYLDALSRLQDNIAPFPYAEVEEIVSSELGVRLSKAFSDFDNVPLAAASLGQVHRAKLRDGREVVVKVQRPGIQQIILDDLEAFREMAGFIDKHTDVGRRYVFQDMLEEFRKALLRELDYRREALNLVTLGNNLRRYERIVVPQPVDDYTTSRILTMDYIAGTKITEMSPLSRIDFDGRALADELCRAYLDQILVDGFFHADPHPGNLLITRDGRLALLDLGMVSRIDPQMQERLLKLILAVTDGRGNDVAQIVMQIGTRMEGADDTRFQREIADLVGVAQDATPEQMKVGRIVMGLSRKAAENGIRPAPELTLLGRALLHMDDVSRALDPEFNPTESVRRHSDSIMQRHMFKRLSPSALFSSSLEMYELVQQLPSRLNTLFDTLTGNRLELKVNAFDESRLMDNLQKIANRIATGLVLAALIVGAALLMQVRTTFTLFGYPGLAMILFLLAAFCGFALVLSILFNDDWRVWRNRPPR
ncbi:MAG TPA: AarF/ABC1/UbiB kinase family protein [Thermoanaerobaculia bacterium]|jgi:predicted unusual protein kinase regulating ubiquinone biosynthesis (AarF/ABC1/UbiB family)|nr:AarF/ABC1/UbiB kinase family protein [Thermoanaerobaculia bacterium]